MLSTGYFLRPFRLPASGVIMDNTTVGATEGPMMDISSSEDHQKGSSRELTESAKVRKCTDLPCLGVFLFLNVCLWTLSGWSYRDGDLYRLERGWDTRGDFCGKGSARGREYAFFPEPFQSIDISLCLPGCPSLDAVEAICTYDESGLDIEYEGCFNAYASKPFFNNYCLPAELTKRTKVLQWLYSQDQVMTRVVGDLARVEIM